MQTKDNIQDENNSLIQPKPSESQDDAKKIEWLKITGFVLLGFISLVGAFYAGMKFSTNKQSSDLINTSVENQAMENKLSHNSNTSPKIPETKSLGETTISFTDVNGEIYLKREINLVDPVAEYPNSKLRNITNVYSQDDRFEPVDLPELTPKDYKWITLVTESIDNKANDKSVLVSDRLFSFKKIPNTDNFLFVVEWDRSGGDSIVGGWSPRKFERVLYLYDRNKVGQELEKIMTFNNKSGSNSFPKIDSFSPEGRYISLDLFSCWNCGAPQPEKLLLDTQSFITKNIGQVSYFSWTNNGNYEYKDYIAVDCKEPQPGGCSQDPKTLPIKTGKM